jgi:hypothetical protein
MNSTKTNQKNDRVKRDYLVWLKEAKQRSVNTVEQVRYAIDRLETYTGFKDFGTFNKDQAMGFKRELLATKAKRSGKTVSISTVHYTLQAINLETAVEAHVQAQGTEPKGFSTAPQFTKTVNSSMASNG